MSPLATIGSVVRTVRVEAYVPYQQEVPAGFHRLGLWPMKALDAIQPPLAPQGTGGQSRRAAAW